MPKIFEAMIKWLEKNKIIPLMITILITIEIFYFSSLQGGPTGMVRGINISSIYHFVVFFLFGFFFFVTIKGNKEIKIKHLLIVVIISIAYAILDEVHQLFVAFRTFDIKDILTDTSGIFSSIIIYLHMNKKTKKTA